MAFWKKAAPSGVEADSAAELASQPGAAANGAAGARALAARRQVEEQR